MFNRFRLFGRPSHPVATPNIPTTPAQMTGITVLCLKHHCSFDSDRGCPLCRTDAEYQSIREAQDQLDARYRGVRRGGVVSLLIALCLLTSPLSAQAQKSRKLKDVRVTFYCASCDGSRKTATGSRFSSAGVAVDPRVIPLGSRVYIPGWGWKTADDTGRLIRGRRVDIRLGSRGQCSRLGVKRLTIRWVPARKKK